MTTTTTAPTATKTTFAAQLVLPGAELGLNYANQLVATIPADLFSKMPSSDRMKDMNSPAFYIGHLSIYGDRVCTLLGRTDLVKPMPYSVDLFKNGAVCLDQPGLYAGKDVLVATFFERQRLAVQAFTSADDKTLQAENPADGRFKEMFPTIGSAVAFLLVGHGQGQDESIRIHTASAEMQQAGQRDGQHEQVDEEEIEREKPDGTFEMRFIDIFDHGDLELARQQQHRQ